MKKLLLVGCLSLYGLMGLQAAKVDTVKVHSASMNKEIGVIIVCPDKALKGEKCPVVYLLHGFGDDGTKWTTMKPNLGEIADKEGLIFICPAGNRDSWYWDSPKVPESRYETFVSKELISYVDSHFPTYPTPAKRAVTGLSMGGHGAMWLAIRHKDVFGAVGSMSGGLDIRPFPNNWGMKKYLGERDENLEIWNNHTVINQLDRLKDGELAIIIDCGVDDFFYDVNKAVHERLVSQKVSHDFISRPGGHNNEYWSNSLDFQILFFQKFFNKESK